jgi:hypothetical protein
MTEPQLPAQGDGQAAGCIANIQQLYNSLPATSSRQAGQAHQTLLLGLSRYEKQNLFAKIYFFSTSLTQKLPAPYVIVQVPVVDFCSERTQNAEIFVIFVNFRKLFSQKEKNIFRKHIQNFRFNLPAGPVRAGS